MKKPQTSRLTTDCRPPSTTTCRTLINTQPRVSSSQFDINPIHFTDIASRPPRTNSGTPPKGNNPIQPFLVFGTPRVSWEQTQTALIGMGVPHTQLQQWHSLYLWDELHQALQGGWDPRQEIEKHLTPFFEYLGDRRYRCIAPMREGRPGEVCGWEGTKRDRTTSHICGHLGYNAWVCEGQCGRIGW